MPNQQMSGNRRVQP